MQGWEVGVLGGQLLLSAVGESMEITELYNGNYRNTEVLQK